MKPYISIMPRIKRGIEIVKEEVLEKEEVTPKVEKKPKEKIKRKVIKKKTFKKKVAKKAELVTGSIMDDFKSATGEDITDEQLEMELEKIGKVKIK